MLGGQCRKPFDDFITQLVEKKPIVVRLKKAEQATIQLQVQVIF